MKRKEIPKNSKCYSCPNKVYATTKWNPFTEVFVCRRHHYLYNYGIVDYKKGLKGV